MFIALIWKKRKSEKKTQVEWYDASPCKYTCIQHLVCEGLQLQLENILRLSAHKFTKNI